MTVPAKPRTHDSHATLPQRHVLEGEVLDPLDATSERTYRPPPHIDVGAVINKALKAAGLMR